MMIDPPASANRARPQIPESRGASRLAEELKSARIIAKLGEKLSAAVTRKQAARIIVEVADELIGWDACFCDLYDPETETLVPILDVDLLDGTRTEIAGTISSLDRNPMLRKVIQGEARLILRPTSDQSGDLTAPFGDTTRRSASLAYVPIRNQSRIIGILSVQSYTPGAYNSRDIESLQALAGHCGAALERIRSEELVRELENQLRHSQKMESIGKLAGGIAHDFNNILTVIQGHASLLKDSSKTCGELQSSLDEIYQASVRAAALTRKLLAFSRKEPLQVERVDLNTIAHGVAQMVRRIIGENIRFETRLGRDLPLIEADSDMMEQVLMNLAINARDAMPGGGTLEVATSFEEIGANHLMGDSQVRSGSFVCLTVADSGTGISAEDIPRIFEPFFTTKARGQGTGLGLAMVYGIVQQHQGWITVASEAGRGSTFKVFLPPASIQAEPRRARDPLPEAESRASATACNRSEVVLIVEDEPDLRLLVSDILERDGYCVLEAENGEAALEIWRTHKERIGLVVSDILLPGKLNGRKLIDRLREEEPGLRVLFTSGYSGIENIDGIGSHFLQKPFRPEQLLQAVRRCREAAPNGSAVRPMMGRLA
jgi:signal transduction histidine kinase/CheY-like chemotaxis protein